MVALSTAVTQAEARARAAEKQRYAEVVVHDGPLRQTVFALCRGVTLGEHMAPPAASVQVIRGAIRIAGEEPTVLETGALEALTSTRHAVIALEDTVFLLTTVTGVGRGDDGYGDAHPLP